MHLCVRVREHVCVCIHSCVHMCECVYICHCLAIKDFFRQIAGYNMNVGDHRIA